MQDTKPETFAFYDFYKYRGQWDSADGWGAPPSARPYPYVLFGRFRKPNTDTQTHRHTDTQTHAHVLAQEGPRSPGGEEVGSGEERGGEEEATIQTQSVTAPATTNNI